MLNNAEMEDSSIYGEIEDEEIMDKIDALDKKFDKADDLYMSALHDAELEPNPKLQLDKIRKLDMAYEYLDKKYRNERLSLIREGRDRMDKKEYVKYF